MRTGKKIAAAAIAAITLSGAALSLSASAADTTVVPFDQVDKDSDEWKRWDAEWKTVQKDFEQVSVTPGADESELGFAWYCRTKETPKVRVSTSKDMKNAVVFKGKQTEIDVVNTERIQKHADHLKNYSEFMDLSDYISNKVTVTGLEANTQYYYQVFKNGEWCDVKPIKTGNPDSFSFLFVGDPQIGNSLEKAGKDSFVWNKVLNSALSAHPDASFLVSAGDQDDKGCLEFAYSAYLAPEALASLPVATSIGNHDSITNQYDYLFNNPNSFDFDDEKYAAGHTSAGTDYYFTYGNALFLVLDSNNENCETHRNVIEKAVSENPDKTWRIAVMHQDLYGSGVKHSEADGATLRTQLTPLFDEYDVDLVFQGHDHAYSRTFQISGDGKQHGAYKYSDYTDDFSKLHEIANSWKAGDDVTDWVKEADLKGLTMDTLPVYAEMIDEFKEDTNSCYVIDSDVVTGTVVDPEGTVYITGNSCTGSKYYDLTPEQRDYIAERSQTNTPSYSVIDLTETVLTVTTYDATTNEILTGTSPYTIVKTVDKSALEDTVSSAQAKLDSGKYTDESSSAVTEAIDSAEAVITNDEATSDEVAEAIAYLKETVSNLETIKSDESGVSTDNNDFENTDKSDDMISSDDGKNPETGVPTSATPFVAITALSIMGISGIIIPKLLKGRRLK